MICIFNPSNQLVVETWLEGLFGVVDCSRFLSIDDGITLSLYMGIWLWCVLQFVALRGGCELEGWRVVEYSY